MKSIFHEETDSEWSVDLDDPKHNRRFIQVPRKPVGTGQSKLRDPDMLTSADGKVVECFPFTNETVKPIPFSDNSPYRGDDTTADDTTATTPTAQSYMERHLKEKNSVDASSASEAAPTSILAVANPIASPSTSPDTRPARSFSVSRKPVQYGVQTPAPQTRTRGYTESDISCEAPPMQYSSTSRTPPLTSDGFQASARPKPKHLSMRDYPTKTDITKALSKIGIKPSGSARDSGDAELQASREEHIRDSYAALERVRDSKVVHEFFSGDKEKKKDKKDKGEDSRERSRSRDDALRVAAGVSDDAAIAERLARLSEEQVNLDREILEQRQTKQMDHLDKHLDHLSPTLPQTADVDHMDGISDDTEKYNSSSDSDDDVHSFVKLPSADIHPVYDSPEFSDTIDTPFVTPFETPQTQSTSTFMDISGRSRSRTPPTSQLLASTSPTKTTNVTPKRVPIDHPSLHTTTTTTTTNPEGRFLIDSRPEQDQIKRDLSASSKGYKYPLDDRFPAATPRQSSPPTDPYQTDNPEPYDCWNDDSDRKSQTSVTAPTRHPFYRYYVMRFSRDLYLTTTPTQHHMSNNQAQSYYVKTEEGFRFMFYTNINEQPVAVVERRDNFLQISYDDTSRDSPLAEDDESTDLGSTVSLEQSIDSQSLSESLSDIVNPSFVGQAIEIPCGDKAKNKKYKKYSFMDELGQEWFITNDKSGVYTFSNANSVVATYRKKENIGKRIVKNGLEWLSQQENSRHSETSSRNNYRAHPNSGPQPVASSIETEASATLTVSELVDPHSNLWKICIGLLVTVAYKKPKQ